MVVSLSERLVDSMLELFPDNPLMLAEAAHSYRELERDAKARNAAESAYQLAPGQEYVAFTYNLVTGKGPAVVPGTGANPIVIPAP